MKTLIFDSFAERLQWISTQEVFWEALKEFDAAVGIDPHNRSLNLAYPVNADTHYMWGASIRRNRARRRLAPQRRPRCQATI